ncbi:MAG: hypothetical protein RLP44_18030 [Aggregatilineales bacterium]
MVGDGRRKSLNDELKKQFKQEIPLGKRSEWRKFLAEQKAQHQRLTDAIIAQETRLNAIVYDAFKLTPEERQLIEDTTKYPYGELKRCLSPESPLSPVMESLLKKHSYPTLFFCKVFRLKHT